MTSNQNFIIMHAFLILPHQHRIVKIGFPEHPEIPTSEIKKILRYSDFVEKAIFPNGDLWCLPEGYTERIWLTPFSVRLKRAEHIFRGKALLVGPYKEGVYSRPLTTELSLVQMIFYPK